MCSVQAKSGHVENISQIFTIGYGWTWTSTATLNNNNCNVNIKLINDCEILMKMSFALFVTTPYNLQIPYVQTQKVLEIGQVFRPLLLAAFNSGVGHPFHDSKNKAEQKKRNARSYCNFPRLARNSMKNNENIYLILVARSQLFSCSSPFLSSLVFHSPRLFFTIRKPIETDQTCIRLSLQFAQTRKWSLIVTDWR